MNRNANKELKTMKHIITTLILIAGFQLSIRAETLVFEKIIQEKEISSTTTSNRQSLESFQNDYRVDLGTIRLEIGEKLTLGEIKHLREQPAAMGNYKPHGPIHLPFIELELKYDFFSKGEKLTLYNESDKTWSEDVSGDIISGSKVNWPIEGPITISLKAKPCVEIWYEYRSGNVYKIHDLVNQFLRITFEKSITSVNNNQNKQQILVLPKGSKNMNVIMESSEDLVNWTTDALGLKTTTDGHRFFRLRAVKE